MSQSVREFITIPGAKQAYVDGKIDEQELEDAIEKVLMERERRHKIIKTAYTVSVAGVILKMLLEADEDE